MENLNADVKELPKFLGNTIEERVEKWREYAKAGVILVDTTDWVELTKLSNIDFDRLGFVAKPREVSDCLVYIKRDVNRPVGRVEGGVCFTDVFVYHYHDFDKVIVAADLSNNVSKERYFEGTIQTNYEFYQLMKQLNIIE